MKLGRRDFIEKLLVLTGGSALIACNTEKPESSNNQKSRVPSPQEENNEPEANGLLVGLNLGNFILHNPKPLALESIRAGIGMGVLTAINRLFIRNNLPAPEQSIVENTQAWRLKIDGVANPITLSFTDIQMFPFANIASVLQCSGNGRQFFQHGPSGSQWATGAAGCVMWGGAWLSDILEACGGALKGMQYITATGGEPLPKDVPRNKAIVERSIPLDKGLKDCLVAWELNGEPIPLSHGGPVRFVVPGYFGCNQIKYVKRIAATPEQSEAKIQSSGYRFRPIGIKGNPSQDSMWRMPVKSWIVNVTALPNNLFRIHGVAFSGERGVSKIEWSIDGSQWNETGFYGPDLGPNAWRVFQFNASLPKGTEVVYTRATDSNGDTQPRERIENERGYGNTSWLDHGYRLGKKSQENLAGTTTTPIDEETTAAGKQVFQESTPACGTCHTLEDAGGLGQVGPNLDMLQPDVARVERAVTNGVGAMPSFGESLTPEQIKNVSRYVAHASKK